MADETYRGTGGEDPAVIDAKKVGITFLKNRLARARQFAGEAEKAYSRVHPELMAAIEKARADFERENALIVAEYERAKKAAESADKELREALVDFYKATGQKTFDEHLSVREGIKLDYELEDATKWAKTEAPFMLVADKKQFEKLAKNKDLDFVKKDSVYTAVIASSLPVDSEG